MPVASGRRQARLAGAVARKPPLAKRACGDIPAQFCTVVDVEISAGKAKVWLLTNDASRYERYQVKFIRKHGTWVESLSAGGFQTGAPDHVRERARLLERAHEEREASS